jgi:hypothetical protein
VQIDGCDGYIGQVWTGTARTDNTYRGVVKERTFETGFFEYGALSNLVRSTGKRMWYLNDPVEDNPRFCWTDYRTNWESTLVASLLWPDVWRFEVAPWPNRVFKGRFPIKNLRDLAQGETVGSEAIPATYATELLTVFNELNNMNQRDITWDCGTRGIGILISDTMMFQRGRPNQSEENCGSFFGLAMPLIKRGSPVEPVQLENSVIPGYLKPYKVLFLTYEGMKPPKTELHDALAKWVRSGGALVFVDDDRDHYNSVKEWWNTAPMNYANPRQHLFEKLGVTSEGAHKVGKGCVIYTAISPASLTRDHAGAERAVALAKEACSFAGIEWRETGYLLLHRGPYVIGAGMDENEGIPVKKIEGEFVNLFSPQLDIVNSLMLEGSSRVFLLDLKKINRSKPQVLASASKVLESEVKGCKIRFHSEGPEGTVCATRLALPSKPTSATVDGVKTTFIWQDSSKTALVTYNNSPAGRWVEVSW